MAAFASGPDDAKGPRGASRADAPLKGERRRRPASNLKPLSTRNWTGLTWNGSIPPKRLNRGEARLAVLASTALAPVRLRFHPLRLVVLAQRGEGVGAVPVTASRISLGATTYGEGESTETSSTIDLARLFKLRLIVARHGEMDLAKWWNSNGMLGRRGAVVLERGFPRTHFFAQARAVFAIARTRCAEIFDPPA